MGAGISKKIVRIFREYVENYKRGCERFGFWWKLFTASMLALALVSFAVILALRFLV